MAYVIKPLYAAPVSEAKAQGVVMPEPMKRGDEGGSGEYGAAMIRGYNACLREVARLNAATVQQVSVPGGFVLAKETVVEMPDGSKELGYTTIGRVGIFNSAEEVFDAIRELDLPLGWVSMTTEQLLPGWMLAAAPAAPAADAGLVEALKLAANRLDRLALEQGEFWRGYATAWADEARATANGVRS